MTWFFEGLPKGERIPWEVWVIPLFWWVCFIAAVTLVSACIVVALRRQWIHHEKLGYPLVSVGIEMATKSGAAGFKPEFMRGKLFWIGVVIPFGIVCWNILTYLVPGPPGHSPGWGKRSSLPGCAGYKPEHPLLCDGVRFFCELRSAVQHLVLLSDLYCRGLYLQPHRLQRWGRSVLVVLQRGHRLAVLGGHSGVWCSGCCGRRGIT